MCCPSTPKAPSGPPPNNMAVKPMLAPVKTGRLPSFNPGGTTADITWTTDDRTLRGVILNEEIDGNVYITTPVIAPNLTRIKGAVTITSSFEAPKLKIIDGVVYVMYTAHLIAPELSMIGGDFLAHPSATLDVGVAVLFVRVLDDHPQT